MLSCQAELIPMVTVVSVVDCPKEAGKKSSNIDIHFRVHKIHPVLTQTNRLHHFDCQVVKKIFKSVLKQSNWPASQFPSPPTVLCLLISLARVLEADTFSCQKRMLSFSQKLNEIAVTSYKSTSLTLCVRLSNQLRKILIFFSL